MEEQFEGTIAAENTPEGAVFILRLPYRES